MDEYPIFRKEYIKETNCLTHINFSNYLNWANALVEQVQTESTIANEIPLTFYPIAKNIRIPSSYMTLNVLNGKRSYINNLARASEEGFWNQTTQDSWYPWLWCRGRCEGDYKNIDGWKYYFDSFTINAKTINQSVDILPPPDILKLFFIYLSCIRYTFQLNEKYRLIMDDYVNKMCWPDNSKILAVQIRRGDTCTVDGIGCRPIYSINTYIANIEIMLNEHNYEYIYISTDSKAEVEEIQIQRPNWKILSLPINRENFVRPNGTKFVDIERTCSLDPSKIPFIVDTGLADLYFISKCQGYISTISSSEFARCGWYLQISVQNKFTPYINMTDKEMNMNEKDSLLLL